MEPDLSSQMSLPSPDADPSSAGDLGQSLAKSLELDSMSSRVRALEHALDSQGLMDLLFFGPAGDPNGLRSALLLVVYVVISAGIALAAGRTLRRLADSRARHRQSVTSRWLRAVVLAEIFIFLCGTTLALRMWSANASSIGLLVGLLGLTGLVVGFRRALDNAIAGIMFSIRGSIRHGDSIEVNKVRGTVHQIALTHTKLSGIDGSMYWIPNRVLSQSILRIGKIKNVTIITVPLPPDLTGQIYEKLRLRAYLCPYRRANSPVRIVDRDTNQPKLELQTWALRDGTRATAHLEAWVANAVTDELQRPSA